MKYLKRILAFILVTLLFLLLPLYEVSPAQAASLKISSSSFTLEVNHYKTLSVKGTRNKVTWSSSNKSIAMVSSTGRVTAKAPGTVTIYARVSGRKLSSKVTVIKLNHSSATLATGDTKTLKVSGTLAKVSWSSSNKSIATVSSAGKVTAKAPGSVTIYASVSGKKLSSKITVVKLNYSSVSLTTGGTKTLKVSGSSAKVTWSSSKKTVATVSSGGKVTAKAPGTATISATVLGKTLKSTITVKAPAKTAVAPTPSPKPTTPPSPTPIPSTTADTSSDGSKEPITTAAAMLIGYYASWAAYTDYTPDQIDATKLTHINYAFANIGSDLKIKLGDPGIDPGNISKLNQLKKVNPALKTLISVGGWSWSERFSDVAATETNRIAFADSLVDFIVKYSFDGVDIDWEYPVGGVSPTNTNRPEDKYNFTLLMKTIREKLDARGKTDGKSYLLSFAGGAGASYIRNTELNKLSQYVDYATIMTYDIHGSWEPYTNFNAPLYVNDPLQPYQISVDSSVQSWLQAGFPKSKLVMGVPFYGYIYNAAGSNNQGLYQTYSAASSISYGTLAAYYLNNPDYKQYFHSGSKVPWLYNGSTFITYENKLSITEKAKYIKEKGLEGAMIWELSQDPNQVLLSTLYQELH